MRIWPFGKKKKELDQKPDTQDVILYQTDLPHIRARKIFECAGLALNQNAFFLIPGAADAIASYQKMDQDAVKEEI